MLAARALGWAVLLALAAPAPRAVAQVQTGADAVPAAGTPGTASPISAPDAPTPLRLEWILLDDDPARVLANLRAAARAGVTRVHLSHRLIDTIDEVLGPGAEGRVARLRTAIERAHELGIEVAIWGREIAGGRGRRFCYDPRGTDLEGRREAWRRGLARLPGVDAVVLGFGSAPRPPWRTVCTCGPCLLRHPLGLGLRSPPQGERLAIVARAVADVVVGEQDRDLVLRTFVHRPQEMAWHAWARTHLSAPFVAMHKSEVPDWEPYHPVDPTLAAGPGRGLLLELDAAGEYQGLSVLPFASPGYFRFRLRPLRTVPGIGAAVRIERGAQSSLGTPNEVNLDAIAALLRDPSASLDGIWQRFLERRYGLAAGSAEARTLQEILAHSFEVQLHARYALGMWAFGKSSGLPRSARLGQLWERGRLPRWDPRWAPEWRRLVHPDAQTVRWLWQEASEAVRRARDDERSFASVRPALRPADAADLAQRLRHQRLAAEAWRAVKLFVWARRAAPERPSVAHVRRCRRRGGCAQAQLAGQARWAWEELGRIETRMRAAGLGRAPVADARAVERFRRAVAWQVPAAAPHPPGGLEIAPLRVHGVEADRVRITVAVSEPARVVLRYGLDPAALRDTADLGTLPAAAPRDALLSGLLPGRRYVVRAEAHRPGEHLRGALHWIFTPSR